MRLVNLLLATLALALLPSFAAAQSAGTTRIETRPFYGATVTLEEGVRVFRPLPPHERVIINPGGATPLNLTFEQRQAVAPASGSGNYAASGSAYPGYSGGVVDADPPRRKPHREPAVGVRTRDGVSVHGHGRGGHR